MILILYGFFAGLVLGWVIGVLCADPRRDV
jgi:hypothetical protein